MIISIELFLLPFAILAIAKLIRISRRDRGGSDGYNS